MGLREQTEEYGLRAYQVVDTLQVGGCLAFGSEGMKIFKGLDLCRW